MKTLQNNYTNPEQSKRLLELGVPADSADCFYKLNPLGNLLGDTPIIISFNLDVKEIVWDEVYATPCWSVGRLVEIYEIVGENAGQCVTITKGTSRIESLVQLYEENAILLDFSKLEEV